MFCFPLLDSHSLSLICCVLASVSLSLSPVLDLREQVCLRGTSSVPVAGERKKQCKVDVERERERDRQASEGKERGQRSRKKDQG